MGVTSAYHLAQLNVARLRFPIDSPEIAEFVAALDPINELAETSDGFVWRLTADDGQSSSFVKAFDDPLDLVNLSVWTDVESLKAYAYRSEHVEFFRRKSEWFERPGAEAHVVAWWVEAGHEPTVEEAIDRLEHLRANGPTDKAFPLTKPFPPPDA